MFQRLVPPFCLLLALSMVIMAFTMLAFGGPEESVQLHQARASGDEKAVDVLEADLRQRQIARWGLIGFLLLGSSVMTVTAFRSMRA